MSDFLVTRAEGGILYLRPSLSGGWLVADEAAGLVAVFPSTSGGDATYSEASGTLAILAPVYRDGVVVVEGIGRKSRASTPTLTSGAVSVAPQPVRSRSRASTPEMRSGSITVSLEPIRTSSRVYAPKLIDPAVVEEAARRAKRILIRQNLSGYYGPTEMRTVVEVADREGKPLGKLDGITGASFECNNNRDNAWSLSLDMRRNPDFNPMNDYVKLIFELRVRDDRGADEWVRRPMGLYRFSGIGGEYLRSHSTWSLSGHSSELLLLEDPLRGAYTVPAGRGVLAEAKKILTDAGVPDSMVSFPMAQDRPLGTAQTFDPFAEESQGTKLRVVNALLAAGSFAAVWTNKAGQFTTRRLLALSRKQPSIRYAKDGEHLMLDGVSEENDLERFANVIVVSSEDPEQEPPIVAYAENNDPNSPGSYQQLGYWKMKEVKMQTITSQESAQEMADAQLKAATAYYQTVGYRSKPDPERGPRERIEIAVEGHGGDDLVGTFDVQSFGGDCHPMPREMSFSASRTRDLSEGWT